MYKVKNIFKKPVFVEGVRLGNHESTKVENITEGIENLKKLRMVEITKVNESVNESKSVDIDVQKTTEVLTEEGSSEIKKRKKSSKALNE